MKAILALTALVFVGFCTPAHSACPTTPGWADSRDTNCDLLVNAGPNFGTVKFDAFEEFENSSHQGAKKPDCRDEIPGCGLCNAAWWNSTVSDAPPGGDLANPNSKDKVSWWYVKDSELRNTTHIAGGHEDIIQMFQGPLHDGGWAVFQDSNFVNGGTNLFVWHDWKYGYGNGTADACPDPVGPGGIVLQNTTLGQRDSGFGGGSNQIIINPASSAALPELWLIDVDYVGGIGWDIRDKTAKVVVIGGSAPGANTDGWPGPLKPRRVHDTINAENCPAGWNGTTCCPNGRVNAANERFSIDTGGSRWSSNAIKFYCYDSIERAVADGHAEPPLVRHSSAGWAGNIEDSPRPVSSPSIEPASGSYISLAAVELAAVDGGSVHYTVNGANPNSASPQYTGPIEISQDTSLKAVTIKDGQTSLVASADYDLPPFITKPEFSSVVIDAPITGEEIVRFEVVPSNSQVDTVVGLSENSANSFDHLAISIRLNREGEIDARNGGEYSALNQIPYVLGDTYAFEIRVNMAIKQYSVTVSVNGATPVPIASGNSFRTEQANANSLSYLSFVSLVGSSEVTPLGSDLVTNEATGTSSTPSPPFGIGVE